MTDSTFQPTHPDEGTRRGAKPHADPGYKADGKKRYPIDNEPRTKAGWNYINMPKNQTDYTPEQVAAIKDRIKTAAKTFGLELKDLGPSSALPKPPWPVPAPLRLLHQYAALGEVPMFEISVDSIQGFNVYVLLDEYDTPIYVGQSVDLLGRLSTHLRDSEKGPRMRTIQILKCKCKAQMTELELRLIQLYRPEFNDRGKGEYIDGYLTS